MRIAPLLDYIARYESEGAVRKQGVASAYDVVFGGIKPADRPPLPLSQMRIYEVLDWQERIDHRYNSEAAGRYQIMEDTLRMLANHGAVAIDAMFDAATQDALAEALMQPHLSRYLEGQDSAEDFCNRLAEIWASLPVVTDHKVGRGGFWVTIPRGHAVYGGVGANHARTAADPDEFLAVVRGLRAPALPPDVPPVGDPEPVQPLLVRLLLSILRAIGLR